MKTAAELLKCAQRELAMRERVYPRRLAEGKMSQQSADHETDCMAAIVKLLEEKAKAEDPQQDLFG